METPITLKIKALAALREQFTCTHEQSELRLRTVAKGGKHYVDQCLRCGYAITGPMKRSDALQICGGKEPKPFDNALMDNWDNAKQQGYDRINAEFQERIQPIDTSNTGDLDEWRKQYATYLASDKWKSKRAKVLARAGNLCEGCAEATPSEVHHLSYENIGDEFLFELVALCEPCHDKLHKRRNERKAQSSNSAS